MVSKQFKSLHLQQHPKPSSFISFIGAVFSPSQELHINICTGPLFLFTANY